MYDFGCSPRPQIRQQLYSFIYFALVVTRRFVLPGSAHKDRCVSMGYIYWHGL